MDWFKKVALLIERSRVKPFFRELMPRVPQENIQIKTEKRVINMTEAGQGLDKAIKVTKIDVALSEQEELERELNDFLQWLKPMLAVDTAGAKQVLTGLDTVNVMREDHVRQGNLAELQEAAPDFAGGFYMVPPIIE